MVMLSNRSTPGGAAVDFRSPNYLLEKSILNRSNALAQPSPTYQQQAATGSKMQLSPEQLDVGSRLVDACLRSDRSFNDLRWKLKLQRTDVPTISGLADNDYPNLQSMGIEINEFVTSRRLPIPQELVDQFAHMQCNCAMGLFPEISRAWLTIDSDLFVWNYETNGDLAYFDGLPNAILKMALARPKAGVFHAHIHYILVVATAADVALLGVSFSDESSQPVAPRQFKRAEMHLVPEPLFKVPLDGAIVADIACTKDGRIFLGARDGCLYEIDYQDKGWFRRYCKKINHSKGIISYLVPSLVTSTFGKDQPLVQMCIDETRHILYTRTEDGSIQVFNMGADGRQMSKVSSMSADAVQHYASSVCQTMEPSNFRPIVHISPVESTESQAISLQAVTESGVRLFFSCYYPSPMEYSYQNADGGNVDQQNAVDYGAITMTQADTRPVTFRLLHVRLPPGLSASSTVARPMRVHLGYSATDGYLFVTGVDEENDTLWAFSDANFPFQSDLMETLTQLPIRGRTWAIAEAEQDFDVQAYESVVSRQNTGAVLPVRPPLTVYQHTEQPKQLVILTAQGIHMIEQQRPVDLLRSLLLTQGADSREVGDFFALHRADHACAMCLIIMCASGAANTQAADAALRAFFVHGGDPQMFFPPLTPNIGDANLDWSRNGSIAEWTHLRSPLQASTPQQSPSMFGNRQAVQSPMVNRSLMGRQPFGDQQQQGPMSPSGPEVKYSHRHNGMYAYFSRIVGQLWSMHLCIDRNNTIESAFLSEELAWLASQLSRFREAIDSHSLIPRPAYIGTTVAVGNQPVNIHSRMIGFMRADGSDANGQQARAQISKKHQVEAVNEERQSLLCLYELVDRSAEVLSLWKILTDHQFHVIAAQLPSDIRRLLTDVPFSHLVTSGKDLCSDLITCLIRQYLGDRATTDAISERLRKACPGIYSSDDATVAKATELVQCARAMEECDARSHLMDDALRMFKSVVQRIHLPTICLQFQDAHCFDKIVDLALCAAEKADPQQLALAAYKTPDAAVSDSLPSRLLNSRMSCYGCVTDALDQLVDPSATALDARMTEQLATMYSEQMLNAVLSTADELAHVAVFDWMLERSMSERMLKSKSPFLENYLQSRVEQGGGHRYLDLLWRFYEKQGRFLQAAQLLFKLAERHNTQTDLKQRLSYLSQAVMCAQSAPDANSVKNAEFLQELKDKLEVARIQNQTRDSLKQAKTRDSAAVRDAIAKLNADLFDVTELYRQFAEKFDLADVKLAIVHCAGHYEQELIEGLWKDIVDREVAVGAHESSDARSKRLATKLMALSKLYSNAPRYFPIDYLCRMLQRKSFECGFAPAWLPKTAQYLSVSPALLLETLHKQYRSRDPLWKTNRQAQIHMMNSLLRIISDFVDSAMDCPANERRSMATKCLDVIAGILVELQTPTTSGELGRLKQQFLEKQSVLERIVAA